MRLFKKVSFEQASKDGLSFEEWRDITLPKRSTMGSAAYDFVLPRTVEIKPGCVVNVPSGIRVQMNDGEFVSLHIRSSIGIKKGVTLSNATGILDQDFYNADNEGHIGISLFNYGKYPATLFKGDRIIQGIFSKYLLTDDDNIKTRRTGGIGSTGV